MEEGFFKLKGKTLVIIDWANVYGWFKKLKWEINPQKLYDYLKSYPEIFDIRFYFGVERGNRKSEEFQKQIKDIGYNLISKQVKWVPDGPTYRRKCDFDVEITKDVLLNINNFNVLILFSGDGDYKVIIEYLLDNKKQAIVVHPFGLRGREYNELLSRDRNRPYLCAVEKLTLFLK